MGKLTKRNILWIIPIGIMITFFFMFGPKKQIQDNAYIQYVQASTLDDFGTQKLGTLADACEPVKWIYFETSKNQDVVELQGDCAFADHKDTKIQFLVDNDRTTIRPGAMLLDNKQLTPDERDAKLAQLLR